MPQGCCSGQGLKRLKNRTHQEDSRLTMKSQLIAIVAAVLVVGCGESPPTAKAPDIPLWKAAKNGNIEVVKQHLAAGVDVNTKSKNGGTPLDAAIDFKHPEIADLLRKHGGKSGAEDSIHVAAELGNIEGVKQHIAAGTDVNAKGGTGWTPLHQAAYGGRKEIAELLIAKGAEVNAKPNDGTTPLHLAAYRGHKESAELLVAKGVDVNAKVVSGVRQGETPLDAANATNQSEIADLLRKHCGKTGKELKGGEPVTEVAKPEPATVKALDISIYKAFNEGNIEAVRLHLAAGVDVNAKAASLSDGTPLHDAASWGHKEIAELLIAAGADVNAKKDDGVTPLHYAAAGDYEEAAELLIAEGADINAKYEDGDTPLDWAIRLKRTEAADLLRKHGGMTGEELALMPRLEYGKDRWPFGFSFTAKDEMTYVVEVTQDFKQWGELETIAGTGKQVKFIDPRQPLVPFKQNFYRVKVVE
jgi:cytohesin